jgi:uncharacterized protein (DUF433 family)
MTKVIEAIYENGVLKPLDEVPLVEHQRVRLTIEAEGATELISRHPQVRQGRPCVAGTGIEVMFIVWLHQAHGLTPEELAGEFNITAEQAQAALDYYAAHREEIDQLIEQHRIENENTQPSLPTDTLVSALKELSRTQRDVATALLQLLRAGKRKEVEQILQAMKDGQAA